MFTIGLIGAGTMGNTHSQAYRQIPGAQITAVCDLDTAKAACIADDWGAAVYTSVEDMLREGQFDAVDVCLPTDLHRWAVELTAASAKPVFCEKPIALTEEDASAMIDACSRAGVTLMVGHVVRFFPEYRAAREQLLSGRLGKPGVVRSIRSGAFPWSDWFADDARSG
ncbi:Gfo/Idh/MocA family protein [Paenibacillus sp. TAB 01]|uniref:Gfo/Idh/MocA family protein n=1 Tax=Paenibacillus sp. TAB 01 TaxID=3368988 RepID=UPI0037523B94